MTTLTVTFEDTNEIREIETRAPLASEWMWTNMGYTEIPIDIDGYVMHHSYGGWVAKRHNTHSIAIYETFPINDDIQPIITSTVKAGENVDEIIARYRKTNYRGWIGVRAHTDAITRRLEEARAV